MKVTVFLKNKFLMGCIMKLEIALPLLFFSIVHKLPKNMHKLRMLWMKLLYFMSAEIDINIFHINLQATRYEYHIPSHQQVCSFHEVKATKIIDCLFKFL